VTRDVPMRDLAPFYRPRSVAVVGAGDRPTSSGGAVLHLLEQSGFVGEIVPVNPKGGTIRNLLVRRSLRELAKPVDLCVIVIRPDLILDAVREAIATGHKNLLVLPGGFAEGGDEGKKRDAELRALAADANITIAGPNCAGIIHLTGKGQPTGMAATFLRGLPPGPTLEGRSIAMVSQSGALAEEIVAKSNEIGIPGRHGRVGRQRDADRRRGPPDASGQRRRHRRDPALHRVAGRPGRLPRRPRDWRRRRSPSWP
jgi:acyl-CoA synthetase (NDP forming)